MRLWWLPRIRIFENVTPACLPLQYPQLQRRSTKQNSMVNRKFRSCYDYSYSSLYHAMVLLCTTTKPARKERTSTRRGFSGTFLKSRVKRSALECIATRRKLSNERELQASCPPSAMFSSSREQVMCHHPAGRITISPGCWTQRRVPGGAKASSSSQAQGQPPSSLSRALYGYTGRPSELVTGCAEDGGAAHQTFRPTSDTSHASAWQCIPWPAAKPSIAKIRSCVSNFVGGAKILAMVSSKNCRFFTRCSLACDWLKSSLRKMKMLRLVAARRSRYSSKEASSGTSANWPLCLTKSQPTVAQEGAQGQTPTFEVLQEVCSAQVAGWPAGCDV